MSVFNVLLAHTNNDGDVSDSALSVETLISRMAGMVSASDYWQPENVSSHAEEAADYYLETSHLLFRNTSQSFNESVHISHCGQYVCVANARLDNREELAKALNIALHADNSNVPVADGALILAAYMQWEEDCAAELLGDFVFTVWDKRQKSLYIGRDHLGIKTVFYSIANNVTLVSNEHNALLQSGLVSRELNDNYIVDQFVPSKGIDNFSPFKAIKRVKPAHYVVIKSGSVRSKCYWQLRVKPLPGLLTENDYLRVLRAKFDIAVKRRLVTEFPIGSELSEGLDSTAITAVAAKALPQQTIYTYSYSTQLLTSDNQHIFGETYKDIFDFLALYSNLEPQWTTQQFDNAAYEERMIGNYGVRPPNPGQEMTRYFLVKESGVRTLLSGWGGDHCVTSYGSFYEDELFRQGKWVKLFKQLKYMKRRGRNTRPILVFGKLMTKYCCPPLFRYVERRRHGLIRLIGFAALNNPLRKAMLTKQRLQQGTQWADDYNKSSVRERDYRELFEVGVETRVVGSEIHARAFNFEYRYPMFDKELIEFAYSVPSYMKCKFGIERWMFREIISDLVTERIRVRMKHDVALPKHERLQLEARLQDRVSEIKQRLHEPLISRFIDPEKLETMLHTPYVANLQALERLLHLSAMAQHGKITLPENT